MLLQEVVRGRIQLGSSSGRSLFLCVSPCLHAQIFYEVQWKADNVVYSGLLIYYNTDEGLMRVRYTINNEYKVGEFKCQYKTQHQWPRRLYP